MLKAKAPGAGFDFTVRNRRPPRDPVNALLSFAYALLAKDCFSAACTVGFDPYQGFYHAGRHGRPSLALDLMEEFRAVIADSVVLSLINNGMVVESDFLTWRDACQLTDAGRAGFFKVYEQRKATEVTHPVFGYRMSYGRMLEVQAACWRRSSAGNSRAMWDSPCDEGKSLSPYVLGSLRTALRGIHRACAVARSPGPGTRLTKGLRSGRPAPSAESGRNIIIFQEVGDLLLAQPTTARTIGRDERQLDAWTFFRRPCGWRIRKRDGHHRAFRQRRAAFQDHDTVMNSSSDLHPKILRGLSSRFKGEPRDTAVRSPTARPRSPASSPVFLNMNHAARGRGCPLPGGEG
jgi:hypothetical protein